jgi:hypothetical protein
MEGPFEFLFGAKGPVNRAQYWRSLVIFSVAGLYAAVMLFAEAAIGTQAPRTRTITAKQDHVNSSQSVGIFRAPRCGRSLIISGDFVQGNRPARAVQAVADHT